MSSPLFGLLACFNTCHFKKTALPRFAEQSKRGLWGMLCEGHRRRALQLSELA